ncbi:hypothetical protein HPHPA9_0096 [Helicobacter pylori Hp A-9]|uniref:Uncharacterized protein n=1 Tax=Helicobacter pylori Hp A-9 TaxID=992034 RepID=J0K5S7_HELPX|nr:hypothetical protein HPHPA9_0096 [Helicobacter pylori Hp A-9]
MIFLKVVSIYRLKHKIREIFYRLKSSFTFRLKINYIIRIV